MNILLVGNGSSTMNQEFGSIIDSDGFDVVMRFNRFKTDGFEKYVGSRTDMWALHDGHAHKRLTSEIINNQSIVIFIPAFKWDVEYQSLDKEFGEGLSYFPPEIELNQINKIVDFKPKWPNIGMVAATWAISEYDKVYMYGFDGFDKQYKFFHYFDEDDSRLTSHAWRSDRVDHDLTKEQLYLSYLFNQPPVVNLNEEKNRDKIIKSL